MSRLTKIVLDLLVINVMASVLFLTGLVDVSSVPALYVTVPLAAVFYGMFLICLVLEKETANFDAEQRAHHNHAVPDQNPRSGEPISGHEHHEPAHA